MGHGPLLKITVFWKTLETCSVNVAVLIGISNFRINAFSTDFRLLILHNAHLISNMSDLNMAGHPTCSC